MPRKTKKAYTKQALTLDQQVQQLISRGMVVSDENLARHYLGTINYYRLAAYWLPFQADNQTHAFVPDTTFEQVLDRYVFDRELRLILIDAIERVEVAVRTQFAYQLGHKYGPHCLLDSGLFYATKKKWNYQKALQQLVKDVQDSKETFIRHMKSTYREPLPPVWATVEIMTLGQLSRWYANLLHGADRNLIANAFGFDEVILVSFLHHLAIVRNLCAHHSRVWNREFAFTFKLPRRRPAPVPGNLNPQITNKLYNTLVLLVYFLDTISPGHHLRQRLMSLLQNHQIPVAEMGFLTGWQQLPIWK